MTALPIDNFHGEFNFLSNFAHCAVEYDGTMYPTVEHAYQAAKTLSTEFREAIRTSKTAGEAKRIGKQVRMRPDWDSVKLDVMRSLLRQKFASGYFRTALLSTRDRELIEGNEWGDYFWGVCNGEGQNWLGKLLMEVRDEVKL